MRAPEFWYGAEGRDKALALQALAWPISLLYRAGGAVAQALARPARAAAPVICIGNVSVGGVGKTPIVRAVRARLGAMGVAAHVLARGHGGALAGPHRVDPDTDDAAAVGDEPLLHAQDGPTWIARDRAAGAAAAIAAGAQVIVMDDGFQNTSLAKDLSLLVFDATMGVGNGRVLPAGPLREPLARAFKRAQGAIVIGGDARPDYLMTFNGPVLFASIAAATPAPAGPLVAFAGIGRPEKFFDTLKALGAALSETVPFPDHHRFSASELDWLATLAKERGAQLITTEKDFVRLPKAFRTQVSTLPIAARFGDDAALDALIQRALNRG
jgi:tetraacyldisaccharide 4'-kinase